MANKILTRFTKPGILIVSATLLLVCISSSLAQEIAIDSVSVDPETSQISFAWSVIGNNTFESFTVVNIAYEVNPRGTKDPVSADAEVANNVFSFSYQPSIFIDSAITFLIWGNLTTTDPVESDYHQIVYLSSEYDSCNNQIQLAWSNYIGWGDDEINYEIHDMNTNNVVDRTTDLSYTITNVETETHYAYFVRAVNQADGRTSSSNQTRISTDRPDLPAYIIGDHASYVDDDRIEVQFTISPESELSHYLLYRSINQNMTGAEVLDTIHELLWGAFEFTDETNYFEQVYYYRLDAVDGCGYSAQQSNVISQIITHVSANNQTLEINWNDLYTWPHGLANYTVHVSNENQWTNSVTTSTNFLDYDLNPRMGTGLPNQFCVYVEAVSKENAANQTNKNRSNTICRKVQSQVFIPESVTPLPRSPGINDNLIPVFSFIPVNYNFQVYNKQGAKVFQSNSPGEAWDASNVESGTFMYYLEFSDENNKVQKLSGTINVFK